MSKLVPTLSLAASLTALATVPADARDAGNFDGTWAVTLVTESGSMCDARYSYSLAVQDGQIRPMAKAASGGATVSGRVGSDGSVGLSVSTSAASGSASGRLTNAGGGGTWQVASFCSGRWTARRSATRTASAE